MHANTYLSLLVYNGYIITHWNTGYYFKRSMDKVAEEERLEKHNVFLCHALEEASSLARIFLLAIKTFGLSLLLFLDFPCKVFLNKPVLCYYLFRIILYHKRSNCYKIPNYCQVFCCTRSMLSITFWYL